MRGARSSAPDLSPAEYLQRPEVAARIREFCGLSTGTGLGCVYIAGMGRYDGPHAHWGQVLLQPPGALPELLARGDDVARSMWDAADLLVYVDVDFMDGEGGGDALLHPADSFLLLEPTYRSLCEVLDGLGMPLLDLATGTGYGFFGRVSLQGPAALRLKSLAPEVPAWHATHAQRRSVWATREIDGREARAHHGLGLVLEYLAHRVLRRAAAVSSIPVVVNNTLVGSGGVGRSCASLDITHMGDPLDSRHLRVAFGLYQKHRLRPDLVGPIASGRVPALPVIPRRRRPLLELLQLRSLSRAAELARETSAEIPDVESGLEALLNEYSASPLARWHGVVRATSQEPHATAGARALDTGSLPPCVAACLEQPNDLLLKPEHLQMLTRTLLARDWSVSEVTGLVRSVYAREGAWGQHWERADPATRAAFDVRVFAGLVAMGLDEGVDLNCVSTQEKGMCPHGTCSFDLRAERERLLARRPS